ncbi:MAG: hypothetical protein WBX22_26185 [Silvibacterium sp.]
MPLSRTITNIIDDRSYTTYLFGEQALQSSWSQPNVPVLVFTDSILPGFSVQNHGGPGGSGLGVELLFWGDWWNSPEGSTRRVLIESRAQTLLNTDYFSELKQYGIERPHWRGALVVTRPSPPGAFNSKDDYHVVPDLIDSLIDDDVYPDPDDERIASLVFLPKGFVENTKENGAHTFDFNQDFLERDYFYVAWIRPFGPETGEDPEDALRTMSHELVELLSDPELSTWYAGNDPTADGAEIADAAVSTDPTGKKNKQTAWVSGVHVQAYWSNQYGATVIPIDRDYQARINGTIKLDKRTVENGTFLPDPEDSRLCDILPQCCLLIQDYKYTIVKRDETVRLRIETQRYRTPVLAWTVEGKPVTANTTLSLDVIAGTFNKQHAHFAPKTVSVQCELKNNELSLHTVGTDANFDIAVSCSVTDGSIVGNIRTNVIAKPILTIGFVGAELTVDPDYEHQRAECEKAAAKMFKNIPNTKSKVKIGDPVEFSPTVLVELPAYARVQQYDRARRAVSLSQMAYASLPKETAKALTASLLHDVPALQAAISAESRKSENGD